MVHSIDAHEKDRLRRALNKPPVPETVSDSGSRASGPVAQEHDGRLAVITGVPHTIGDDGGRYYDTEVAHRLDSALREMTASSNQVPFRAWTDIAGSGNLR